MMALRRLTTNILCLRPLNLCTSGTRLFSANYQLSGLSASSILYPVKSKSDNFVYNAAFASGLYVPCRYSTIFSNYPGEMLWEGVTGPKGGSKRRARGKRRVTRQKINLHVGQRLGFGKASIQWPGLTTPASSSIKQGDYNEKYFERLEMLRNKSAVKKKRMKLAPLQRGWTGKLLGGQSVGPPTPNHPDFDCFVIESKVVATVTATKGRYRRFSVVVATGNGQGLCGIGKAKALNLLSATRRAKLRASQNIVSFELKEGRTLWHVGYVCQWNSKIFATPLSEGAGLKCHRMIQTLCQVIGIKDMYARVEGSTTNYQAIAKGFLRLLKQQKTYEDLANSLGLHVVEFAADRDMYPHILASPACNHTNDFNKNDANEPGDSSVMTHSRSYELPERLPLLVEQNPTHRKPRKPIPEEHDSFLDDLIDVNDDTTTEINVSELLAAGERDLDSLMLGGRVPLKKSSYHHVQNTNSIGIKRKEERHRYRNQQVVRRERNAHITLSENSV
uniref:Small ribosomal subunit protein uS5m n=1 Tax=Schistosoma mansoni TaxID=6183 RepID=A0A5K4FAM5_SCHMA